MKCRLCGREIETGVGHYDTPWGIFCVLCMNKWMRIPGTEKNPLEL